VVLRSQGRPRQRAALAAARTTAPAHRLALRARRAKALVGGTAALPVPLAAVVPVALAAMAIMAAALVVLVYLARLRVLRLREPAAAADGEARGAAQRLVLRVVAAALAQWVKAAVRETRTLAAVVVVAGMMTKTYGLVAATADQVLLSSAHRRPQRPPPDRQQ